MGLLTRPPGESGDVYLWPCNITAWQAFMGVQTQWLRAGMSGAATGLRYEGVIADLRAMGIRGKALQEMWPALKAAELAVLGVWAKERQRLQDEQQQQPQQPR